jgi:hypothetical protein
VLLVWKNDAKSVIEISPPLTVSPVAQRFVCERQAEASLKSLVELTTHIFPDALRMFVDLHEDSEIADLRWVLIRVEVAWADAERARRARDEWYTRTAKVIAPAVLADFGLEIDRCRPDARLLS